nr:DNA repair protein RecN [Sunxiuqinia sp.]
MGKDEVRFLFSANKSAEPQEISKIASGGEMSRLMLALKSLITDSKSLPTIVFDEIDTGISGEIAVKMGDILKGISTKMQVINITHLPQIAAKGDHHYQVYKFDEGEKTFTSIRKLENSERVDELAQMLSGDRNSDTARETARELLD